MRPRKLLLYDDASGKPQDIYCSGTTAGRLRKQYGGPIYLRALTNASVHQTAKS